MPDTVNIVPRQFDGFSAVLCAVSTRRGGVSPEPLGMNLSYSVGDDRVNVEENRKRFFGSLGIHSDRVAYPKQCHSPTVRRAEAPGSYDATDGLVTDRRDLWLAVSIADCTPVFVFDRAKNVIGAFHSGWRGSAAGIVNRGITAMAEEYGSKPSDLHAYIGPSAGSCCYEVGSEVAKLFTDGVVSNRRGFLYLDLKRECRRQLLESGVPDVQIEVSGYCTICSDNMFHSYRRDKERSGRMLGIIGLKG